jgi:hypothetical protein
MRGLQSRRGLRGGRGGKEKKSPRALPPETATVVVAGAIVRDVLATSKMAAIVGLT